MSDPYISGFDVEHAEPVAKAKAQPGYGRKGFKLVSSHETPGFGATTLTGRLRRVRPR